MSHSHAGAQSHPLAVDDDDLDHFQVAIIPGVLVNFQDAGNVGLFWHLATGPWHMGIAGIPLICGEPRFLPARVLTAWSIPGYSPIC